MPTHTVTVVTRPTATRDRQNNLTYDWSSATRTDYQGRIQPSTSSRTRQQSDQVVSYFDCLLPPGTAVTAYDRIEVGGTTYEIDGEPSIFSGWGPISSIDHIAVRVKEMSG